MTDAPGTPKSDAGRREYIRDIIYRTPNASTSREQSQIAADRILAEVVAPLDAFLREAADYEFARAEAAEAKLETVRTTIDARLNNYLVEMKEGYDDSITGFNEAWDIVRDAFGKALAGSAFEQAGDGNG